jgi:hypothetical protein
VARVRTLQDATPREDDKQAEAPRDAPLAANGAFERVAVCGVALRGGAGAAAACAEFALRVLRGEPVAPSLLEAAVAAGEAAAAAGGGERPLAEV